jgi:hypothetical protein
MSGFAGTQGRTTKSIAVGAIAALVLVATVALIGCGANSTRGAAPPAPPVARLKPPSVFTHVRGAIAIVGNPLVGVDPHGYRRVGVVSLSPGAPIAWSRDGSELLIDRHSGLFVLGRDGHETRIAPRGSGGSFTPDGRSVVYGDPRSGIEEVSVTGGPPRSVTARYPSRFLLQTYGGGQLTPDGSKVAAVKLRPGRPRVGIWLLAVRGAPKAHALVSPASAAALLGDKGVQQTLPLGWSWDGSRFAFGEVSRTGASCVIFTVAAGGSNIRRLTSLKRCAYSATWGRPGSGIGVAFLGRGGTLTVETFNVNRTPLQRLGQWPNPGGDVPSIAWNPLG